MTIARTAFRMSSRALPAFAVFAAIAVVGGAAHPVSAEPRQFRSGGLEVVINRATPPGRGDFGVSLIITNTQDSPVEVFTSRGTLALADTGQAFSDPRIGGLPSCLASDVNGCAEQVQRGRLTPLTIDAKQSATITMVFGSRQARSAANAQQPCSLDLSMPVYMRTLAGRTPSAWQRLTVGLPNIKVC